ncbi:uncharacterized protein LOC126381133 [Pectinophora gossypiella]|uniref:uncharacterized protein LOC126381133 n=1 Tax=Pectinophora gossypiella TaxID=13191 RepID=UPI00214EB2EB|nr:uncharacterized protein LOC126381133 [Pectinophora gossypiella]
MSIGKIEPFNMAVDNWTLYVERLEQYFIVNNVKSELKVATLITVMGSETYELLVNLCTPEKPSSKTFSELVTIMQNHLQPKPSILAERYRFKQRVQKQGETIAEYMAELKKLSKTCMFASCCMSTCIRDQFVCGLSSETIMQRLFAEDDGMKLEKLYKLAISMEAAEKNAAYVEKDRFNTSSSSGKETYETSCNAVATRTGYRGASRGGGGGGRGGSYGPRAHSYVRPQGAQRTPIYCEVFSDGLGRYTGGEVSLRLRPDARPVFLRARPLAYALREPVERALDQLLRDDVIAPVETSDWATPIVPDTILDAQDSLNYYAAEKILS